MRTTWCTLAVALAISFGCNDPATGTGERAQESSATETPVATVAAPDSASAARFERVMDYARTERLHERPLGEIMQAVGLRFRGEPYVAGMLDVPAEETLICRLDGFDCVTFVETTLALARGIAEEDYSYDTFVRHVQNQRYRGGELAGYCSRLHYFTEWILDNEERGNVADVTREAGGEPLRKRFNFMTSHRESYPRLVASDSLFACVEQMEARLAEHQFYYIPKARIRAAYDALQAGDIVATATNIQGLDVTHTGLVYDNGDGTKGLLHASPSGGVKLSPDLHDYLQENAKQIGIVVARPTATGR